MASKVRSGDPDNIESQAARLYWNAWLGVGVFRRRRKGAPRTISSMSTSLRTLHPLSTAESRIKDIDLLKLTDERAQAITDAGDEAIRWALLKLSATARKKSVSEIDPATPSAMVPPYKKARQEEEGQETWTQGRTRGAPPSAA